MNDTTTPAEPSPIAVEVHAEVTTEHADCSPEHCALKVMWAEDVQEILEAYARRMSAAVLDGATDTTTA